MHQRFDRRRFTKKERNVIAGLLALFILGLVNYYRENPKDFSSTLGYLVLAVFIFFTIRKVINHYRNKHFYSASEIELNQVPENSTTSDVNSSEKIVGQTKYARLLYGALKQRGIESITEYNDGHKTVDLAILPSHLYIEVDGVQHLDNPEQIIRDFKRDFYSEQEGFHTLHIPNEMIKKHLNSIADAIAEVVREKT